MKHLWRLKRGREWLHICGAPLARLNRVCIESCRGREALGAVGDTLRQTLRERLALAGFIIVVVVNEEYLEREASTLR